MHYVHITALDHPFSKHAHIFANLSTTSCRPNIPISFLVFFMSNNLLDTPLSPHFFQFALKSPFHFL